MLHPLYWKWYEDLLVSDDHIVMTCESKSKQQCESTSLQQVEMLPIFGDCGFSINGTTELGGGPDHTFLKGLMVVQIRWL